MRKAVTEETACVILETIQATGGVLIAPEGYFAEVREICDDKGVMMISDEVQAGLGRTGELWAIYGGITVLIGAILIWGSTRIRG